MGAHANLWTHELGMFSHSLIVMDSSFEIESMICGYHVCKAIWEDPINGEMLVCESKVGNPHDPLSVAVKKMISGESTIVGHFP